MRAWKGQLFISSPPPPFWGSLVVFWLCQCFNQFDIILSVWCLQYGDTLSWELLSLLCQRATLPFILPPCKSLVMSLLCFIFAQYDTILSVWHLWSVNNLSQSSNLSKNWLLYHLLISLQGRHLYRCSVVDSPGWHLPSFHLFSGFVGLNPFSY